MLRSRVRALTDELEVLRRKLAELPARLAGLEDRITDGKSKLSSAVSQNEKLTYSLREARDAIAALRDEVDKLTQPPAAYGTFLGVNADGTADVQAGGRKMRVNLHPDLDVDELVVGAEVVLNESFNVVAARGPDSAGEIASLVKVLDDGLRARVTGRAEEERVVDLAGHLVGEPLRAGDNLLLDVRANLAVELLPRPEVDDLLLEQVPDITYADIGGLDAQIELIVDAVELPYLHQDLFRAYDLPAPKGILLYGPPGCGKTLIAKAVANSLAAKVAQVSGVEGGRSFFINIKGPELLNKYVGETERQIRRIFERAREKAGEGWPVIVFFDEMESLFRTRGSGISSDMESTVVPQLLAEIDGVEGLRNVIVIGASNREDLIDPAILRPGRLDVKIKIDRPAESAAASIFGTYITADLPIDALEIAELGGGDAHKAAQAMIETTVEEMYRPDELNRFLEVTYQDGDKEVMYFKDFASGAMIENIVRRAKKNAIKRSIATGSEGIRLDDLRSAMRQEFREHEDLPNTTNPDDWAKISGKKGQRIVFIRTLVGDDADPDNSGGRAIERARTGQYL
ncbi:MAG TPA: proteasome ATPase [Acidimicrobiaceae bacterium]|nr:proteasome ATPase [Acidimicrobiaceae bacterium]HCB37931.1 proteasome ATPase [Acidimicrobiaceae bacterium]